jgi:hypothetical protein
MTRSSIAEAQTATLSELIARNPTVPAAVIYYLTRRYCTAVGYSPPADSGGNSRNCSYGTEEFKKALARWKTKKLAVDCLEFKERGKTWVAEKLLRERTGICRETADKMFEDELIVEPRIIFTTGPTPWYRKFWPLEDVQSIAARYAKPKDERDAVREPSEIASLTDDDFVTKQEAKKLGFSAYYLRAHSEGLEDKRNRAERTPSQPIGRFIEAKWGARISDRDHRVREQLFRLGDLRDVIAVQKNPPVPEGGRLLVHAVPALKSMGLTIGRRDLVRLIQDKTIRGGTIKSFKRNLSPCEMWYMVWEDRNKLPGIPPGGLQLDVHAAIAETLDHVRRIPAIDKRTKRMHEDTKKTAAELPRIGDKANKLLDEWTLFANRTISGGAVSDREPEDTRRAVKKCWHEAHASLQRAVDKGAPSSPLRAVYDWLKERDDKAEYELPAFLSWERYVRAYERTKNNVLKASPRAGRQGRSIVDRHDV